MQPGGYLVLSIKAARPLSAAFVLIERDGKYLFVLRGNTKWMNGYYGLPSGKVEDGEGFLMAAVREAREEVGVELAPETLRHVVTVWRQAEEPGFEWCDVAFVAGTWSGEPYNAEPTVHDRIAWFGLDELPENIVPNVKEIISCYQKGQTYSEIR